MRREDTYRVKIRVDDMDLGTWSMFDGGETMATSLKDRRGGLEEEEELGGPTTTSNVTVERTVDLEFNRQEKRLRRKCGRNSSVLVFIPLDADGNPFAGADTMTFSGMLMGVKGPTVNSQGTGKARARLTFSVNGLPS